MRRIDLHQARGQHIPDFADALRARREQKDDAKALDVKLGKLLLPDISRLSTRTTHKANLVNASHEFYGGGLEAAKDYLKERDSPYTIDEELSDRDHIVALDKGGKAHVAFRGTEPGRADHKGGRAAAYDISAWTPVFMGVEEGHHHFEKARDVMQDTIAKHGKPSEVLGYSLGGAKAISIGERYSVPTTTFNPLLGKTFSTGLKGPSHKIFRTTEDIASSIAATTRKSANVQIKSINPIRDAINPVVAHDLSNFADRVDNARTHKVQRETLPLMRAHMQESQSLSKLVNGPQAVLLAQEVGKASAHIFENVTDSVTNVFGGAALETGAKAVGDVLAGQRPSQLGTTFRGALKSNLAAVPLAPLVNPVADAVGDLTKTAVQGVTGTTGGGGVAAELAGGATSGAAASALTAVGVGLGTAAVTGAEIGSVLGPAGMAAGAAVGAGIGVASTAAEVLFNPNSAHRERINRAEALRHRNEAHSDRIVYERAASGVFGGAVGRAFGSAFSSVIFDNPLHEAAANVQTRVMTYQADDP